MREESEKKGFCKIRGRESEPHGRRMRFQLKKNEFFGLADCSELSCLCAVETLHDEHITVFLLWLKISGYVQTNEFSNMFFLSKPTGRKFFNVTHIEILFVRLFLSSLESEQCRSSPSSLSSPLIPSLTSSSSFDQFTTDSDCILVFMDSSLSKKSFMSFYEN